jgi:hypothetical protein
VVTRLPLSRSLMPAPVFTRYFTTTDKAIKLRYWQVVISLLASAPQLPEDSNARKWREQYIVRCIQERLLRGGDRDCRGCGFSDMPISSRASHNVDSY